jgi:tol-pal system protein YbgF
MSRALKAVELVLLTALAGCATTRTAKVTSAAETEATLNTLRAQNSGYIRRIEELQNRVFILEDRLDSQRVVGQQRAAPTLPVSRTLRATPPTLEDEVTVEPGALPPRLDPTTETAQLDTEVEYSGEATHPLRARPVLRIERSAMSQRSTARAPVVIRPPLAVTPPPLPAPASLPAARTATPAPPPPIAVVASAGDLTTSEDPRPPEPIPAEPLRLYRAALMDLRAGHHGDALAGFRRFLSRYPAHDYADNAQYWIAECYYDLKQNQTAAREFRRVIERYPAGNKVPDAMLKLGFSHLALEQMTEGRQVLESLIRAYPKHAAAALATTRLAELPRRTKADVHLGAIAPGAGTRPAGPRPPEAR